MVAMYNCKDCSTTSCAFLSAGGGILVAQSLAILSLYDRLWHRVVRQARERNA